MQQVNVEKFSINFDQQSTLARLLAQENIHVIHGNYRTAWFDPEKRVLALPIWKNRGKAVYDLLTGHEVGHALYTPGKGWHDAVDDIAGAPKAYLNVLEDVRIERKVQDKYPGLRAQFKKAYKVLAEEDFFGLANLPMEMSEILLIDRINLFYKLGDHVEVEFIDKIEKDFASRAYKTETFEDVVNLAKEIYAYQKELYKQMKTEEKPVEINSLPEDANSDANDGESPEDYHKPDAESEQEKANSNDDFTDVEEEDGDNADDPTSIKAGKKPDDEEQKELESNQAIDKPAPKDKSVDDSLQALDAITDKAFRNKENELTAGDEMRGSMVYSLNKPRTSVKEVIIDYKEYYAHWNSHLEGLDSYYKDYIAESLNKTNDEYLKFKNNTEMAAAYMAKEFELRKAAYQYSRSTISKTGIIDTNKLHAYKFSEDIFLKSTKLANYKNHGMMMFIDFSGSMQDNIGPTIRQLLNLTSFCKMVNIPFEVYAFTTRVKCEEEKDFDDYKSYVDCEIIYQKFNLLNLVSSRMSRTEYQQSMRMLWNISKTWDGEFANSYICDWNQLHSTPLNSCIAYANDMIRDFKLKNGVEKMTTMFLTDGASDSFQVRVTEEGDKHRTSDIGSFFRTRKCLMRFAGHTLDVGHMHSGKVTEDMLKTIKKTAGTTILGFFISQYRNEAVSKVCDATNYRNKDDYVQQLNKNKAIIQDNLFGYDRYFGLCQKYMDIVEDEFGEMVEDGASKNKIKTAFAKITKAKRVNRILLNAFVDAIA